MAKYPLTPTQQETLRRMRAAEQQARDLAHEFLQTLTEEQQGDAWNAVAEQIADADTELFPTWAAEEAESMLDGDDA